MADEIKWYYEKLDEDYKLKRAPINDMDGKITGHIVYGLKAWFDEHEDERKRLGYIKHYIKNTKDIEYNHQTQYLTRTVKSIDEWTVEDEYHIVDMSEEQMRLAEIGMSGTAGVVFMGDEEDWLW